MLSFDQMRLLTLSILLLPVALTAKEKAKPDAARDLYQQYCASCHGEDFNGGLGNSLIDDDAWTQVGKTTSFLQYVKQGNLDKGMPGFEGSLTDAQIRSMEIYLIEQRKKVARKSGVGSVKQTDGVYSAGGYDFRAETVVEDLNIPWSITFLPDGGFLIAERPGKLWEWTKDEEKVAIEGIPEVWANGQGGLLEVALHPDYAENGWVYLAFSATPAEHGDRGTTKIVRGRINGGQWVDEAVIFEAPTEQHLKGGVHFGSRLAFQDGYLFFSIGDRGKQDDAQDVTLHNGKIHRLHDDGRIPKDNPFVSDASAFPSLWTLGNRNAQGLDLHPVTGDLYEAEHGPRGGDEVNLIEKGKNYGWPLITYGMNYNGKPITDKTEAPGLEQPLLHWTPSIAVCGIEFYEGDVFPEWTNNLFAGGLGGPGELHRLIIEDRKVVSSEVVVSRLGRIRDVASGPDGHLYLVLNQPHRIMRLVPAK